MTRNTSLIALFLATLMLFSVNSNHHGDLATIVVSGSAEVKIDPDTALLFTYLQTEGSTAEQATDNAAAIVDQIIAALQANNLTKDDVATSYYSLYPRYDYSTGTPVVTGYIVYQSLTITIRGITATNNKIALVIDALAGTGVNSISGITFTHSDEQKGKQKARTMAFNEAKQKAQQYAKLAGRKLGKIIKIDETTPAYLLPYSYNTATAAMEASQSNIPIGKIIVRVAVVIVWVLI